MNRVMAWLRGVAGVLIGYAAMGGLITLVQEAWLGGVTWQRSSWPVLMAGGAGTFLCAIAGGAIGAWIGPHRPLFVGTAMSALAIVETTWLIRTGRVEGPLWFDIAGAGSLVLGMLIGSSWRSLLACCLPSPDGQAGRAPRRISTFQTRN